MMERLWAATAAAFLLGASGASAAFLDFTDPANFSSTGSIGGVSYEVTAFGGPLRFNADSGPGAGTVPPLAGIGDGLGVGDDEIDLVEAVIIGFSKPVFIEAIYLLDLFAVPGGNETAVLSNDGAIVATLVGTAVRGSPGFGAFFANSDYGRFLTSRLIVPAGPGNDDLGVGDFALAGLEITPIPLPAGLLLLGSALAGLGLGLGRRRRA